jgi:hypothetical protein
MESEGEVPPIVHEVLRSPGQPLDPATRAFFEPRFSHDFSQVRLHTDTKAAESARAVNALAYTVGQDVVFGTGQYAPQTGEGKKLLAHELTHVMQQQNVTFSSLDLEVSQSNSVLEKEANAFSISMLRHEEYQPYFQVVHFSKVTLSRQPAEQLRPTPPRPTPSVRQPPPLRVIEGGLSRATARSAQRIGWRYFWRAVARRFALRGAIAAALAAADGPLPIGELIDIGLALWTIWEIVQLWDVIWSEASQMQHQEEQGALATQPQPQPQPERERDPRQECRRLHPYALNCTDHSNIEEVAIDFLINQGYDFTDLGDCRGINSFGPNVIDACDGAPGESWHCRVNGTSDEISIFGCLCCNEDGTTGFEWRGAHWSVNLSRRRTPRR